MQRMISVAGELVILLAMYACYRAGFDSGFMFDDSINITTNPYLWITDLSWASLWQAAQSGAAGMFKRPVSMLTFALDYYWAGLDARHFKSVNLAIHAINTVLVFELTRLLLLLGNATRRITIDAAALQWIVLCTAALWALHPIHLTSVLYVVQRMTSLSAMFTLLGLVLYCRGRFRMLAGRLYGWWYLAAAFFFCMPLALFSKENGILLPVFMFAIEWSLLRWGAMSAASGKALRWLSLLIIAVPVVLGVAYLMARPEVVTSAYSIRNFSLTERLMTESRVLWFYLRLVVAPDISAMGFHHDDIEISRGLLSPMSTLPALLALAGLAAGAFVARNRYPLVAFGIAFFLIGHALESTIFALEIAFEHRNYLPVYGIVLALVSTTLSPQGIFSLQIRRAGLLVFIVIVAMVSFLRASYWSDPVKMRMMEAQHHPNSIRSHVELGAYLSTVRSPSLEQAKANYDLAIESFRHAASLSSTDTSGLFSWIVLASMRGFAVDTGTMKELCRRLEFVPFAPSSANSIMLFTKCLLTGQCAGSPEMLASILDAAVRNPTLAGRERAMVLFAYSDYLSIGKHDIQGAVRYAYQALDAAPGIMQHRFTLIRILISLGRLDEAAVQLHAARGRPGAGSYAPTMDVLDRALADARKRTGRR